MLVRVHGSKIIMWLISGVLFLELGSCMSTAGWGTQTSVMLTNWERFTPASRDPGGILLISSNGGPQLE